MADEGLKDIEARLTRIEAALAGASAGGAGAAHAAYLPFISDPGPWPYPGGGGYRPPWGGGGPGPIVDKASFWGRMPIAVVDPPPDPWGSGGWGGGWGAGGGPQAAFARVGHIGDPPVVDVSRMSIAQLESSLHTINAERARLGSMETMIKQQLEKLKQHG
jgi:hypothetical protein